MKLNKEEINALRDLLSDEGNRNSEVLTNLHQKLTGSGTVELYVDGAADLHSKTAGIGGVLFSNGEELYSFSDYIHDKTNNEIIQNVTYFLSISKDNENLLKDYFFAEDGILIITIEPNNELPTRVIGEKQYDNNAYVMPGSKYDPATSGESLTSTTPIRITGPIFDTEGIYNFDIELRTIDNRQNWVFSLSGFHSQISIEKDIVVEETFTESKSSFQTEDFFRKLFSYYKTPILLNEIFR